MDYFMSRKKGVVIITLDGIHEQKFKFENTIHVNVILDTTDYQDSLVQPVDTLTLYENDIANANNPPQSIYTVKTEPVISELDLERSETSFQEECFVTFNTDVHNDALFTRTSNTVKDLVSRRRTSSRRVDKSRELEIGTPKKQSRKSSKSTFTNNSHKATSSTPLLKCDLCEFTAKSEQGLKVHKSAHKRKRKISDTSSLESVNSIPYVIPENDSKSDTDLGTATSASHKRKSRAHVCDECGKEESSIPGLKQHKRAVHGEYFVHKCSVCQAKFKSLKELCKHKKDHPKSRRTVYHCGFCNKPFGNFNEMRAHRKIHGLFCKICKETFHLVGQLNMHLKEHHLEHVDEHGAKSIQSCTMCSRVFQTEKKLKKHMTTHSECKAYVCFKCGKMFSWKRTLFLHGLRFHSDTEGTQKNKCICTACGKEFPYMNSLTHHVLRVHKEKAYKCNQCPKAFYNTYRLQRHMRAHTKEQPYQCDVCQKKFSQSYNLSVHMRTHTKEKPFICNICWMPFAHKCSMQGHMRAKHNVQS